jgi:zinc transport system substrate-binding protein
MKQFSIFFVLCLSFCVGIVHAEERTIWASNYPLSFFAEKISGKPEIVIFPEIEGDPAFREPNTADILTMQQSDIILLNGATYEKWLTGVAHPKRKIVDTSKAFKEQYIIMKEAADHSHGPSGEHSHSGTAFTTWIDFNQAAFQAKAIKDAMAKQNILSKEVLNRNFESLIEDLRVLDTEINEMVLGYSEVPLIASHPVYQYFARRYGLNIKAVLWEPDVFPDEQMWTHLEEIVKEYPAKWMIWEGEPLPQSVAKLKEMGIKSIVFDPCGNQPQLGDFLSVMRQNVENLREIFRD